MIRRAAVAVIALFALTACGSSGGGTSPAAAMAAAKTALDAAPGVHVVISSANLPSGQDGLVSADGVLVRENPSKSQLAAFKGTAKVTLQGFTADVGATAIGGKVYATNVPLVGTYTASMSEVGFPDPAQLLNPATGVSSLLTSTSGLTAGGQSRTGANNDIVVTTYSGTLTSAQIAKILPVSSGTFNVIYSVLGDGKLYSVQITGPFFSGSTSTYTLTLDKYDTNQTITAP